MKTFGFLSLFLLIAVSQAFVTPKPVSLAPTIAKSSSNPLQEFFQDLFPKKEAIEQKPKFEPVIIDQDFRVGALFLSLLNFEGKNPSLTSQNITENGRCQRRLCRAKNSSCSGESLTGFAIALSSSSDK